MQRIVLFGLILVGTVLQERLRRHNGDRFVLCAR